MLFVKHTMVSWKIQFELFYQPIFCCIRPSSYKHCEAHGFCRTRHEQANVFKMVQCFKKKKRYIIYVCITAFVLQRSFEKIPEKHKQIHYVFSSLFSINLHFNWALMNRNGLQDGEFSFSLHTYLDAHFIQHLISNYTQHVYFSPITAS